MSSLIPVGQLITSPQSKDAIHVSVAPVKALHVLLPGQRVGLTATGLASSKAKPILGVIDPFLEDPVLPSQECWLFLLPGSVTGLRHDWYHPAFSGAPGAVASPESPPPPDAVEVEASVEWIRDWAKGVGMAYSSAIDAAKEYLIHGTIYYRSDSSWVDPEFWDHYERVTGTKVVTSDRGQFFGDSECRGC